METPEAGMCLRCGDCGGWASMPGKSDAPWLIRHVRAFLDQHRDCSFSVTLVLSGQRKALDRVDLTTVQPRASR